MKLQDQKKSADKVVFLLQCLDLLAPLMEIIILKDVAYGDVHKRIVFIWTWIFCNIIFFILSTCLQAIQY